jgi:hypothetical protein
VYVGPVPHRAKRVPENRTEGRANVFLTAMLDAGGVATPVRIRNISARGALVDGPTFPALGASVRLMRGRLLAAGQIAWAGAGQAGLNFDREIDVASWVQRAGHGGQERVDGVVAALRSGAPVRRDRHEASETLSGISGALDQICERLTQSGRMSLELGEELLKLDAVAQSLRRLATGKGY